MFNGMTYSAKAVNSLRRRVKNQLLNVPYIIVYDLCDYFMMHHIIDVTTQTVMSKLFHLIDWVSFIGIENPINLKL